MRNNYKEAIDASPQFQKYSNILEKINESNNVLSSHDLNKVERIFTSTLLKNAKSHLMISKFSRSTGNQADHVPSSHRRKRPKLHSVARDDSF